MKVFDLAYENSGIRRENFNSDYPGLINVIYSNLSSLTILDRIDLLYATTTFTDIAELNPERFPSFKYTSHPLLYVLQVMTYP